MFDSIVAHEATSYGWRALTSGGEVLEIRGANGGMAQPPAALANDRTIDIGAYLERFDQAIDCYRANDCAAALVAVDAVQAIFSTLMSRFNRSMILLALGRWDEGFAEYGACEMHVPFRRPPVEAMLAAGLRPWNGEDVRGKTLKLVHAHGFGDSIMCLRYVPRLTAMGASVVFDGPLPLQRLVDGGVARIRATQWEAGIPAVDYFCALLHLLRVLKIRPDNVFAESYLDVDTALIDKWRRQLGPRRRQRIGIAWDVGNVSVGDYPRSIPLGVLVEALGDADLFSVQMQGVDEARARGVIVYQFEDFADCAALMLCLDEVVSIDTAALHLAGAIGHPCVSGLLSHWHSWRWLAPWYPNMTLHRQAAPGDWASALAQRRSSKEQT